ncbi:hypothetical protein IAQ61_010607 [Plenodomus lingam]|uniref:uncharacterized protein n=1 Tax=Leptosphaeria maculans TaxID=5022 RepID=UPI003331ABB4|nr:hypothetical protein IAQ61_010607 [Plenodomus lingam]
MHKNPEIQTPLRNVRFAIQVCWDSGGGSVLVNWRSDIRIASTMAFPLDVYPVMSEISELREKANVDGAAPALEADLLSSASPQHSASGTSSLATPTSKGGVGKAWRRMKKGLRPGDKVKKKADTTIPASVSSRGTASASNGTSRCERGETGSSHAACTQLDDCSLNSSIAVGPASSKGTISDDQDSEAAKDMGSASDKDDVSTSDWFMTHGLTVEAATELLQWGGLGDDEEDITALPSMSLKSAMEQLAKTEKRRPKKLRKGGSRLPMPTAKWI